MTIRARFAFVPQDCWIGLFWETCVFVQDMASSGQPPRYHVVQVGEAWLCVLPMLPLHISWQRPLKTLTNE
jgi:hypothetical protein